MAYIGAQPADAPSLSHQTFYGFKYNPATGSLVVDVIDDDTKVRISSTWRIIRIIFGPKMA